MKKFIVIVLTVVFLFGLIGCRNQTTGRIKTVETDLRTYYELEDGTWECEGHTYKHKLEITGRMRDAAVDSTFVFLSNIENISFYQAWKAAGGSSNSDDYFSAEDTILVDVILN